MSTSRDSHTPPPAGRARIGTAVTVAGIDTGLGLAAPWLGAALTAIQAVLGAVVVLTALYGRGELSDRAFRMLPWTTPPPGSHEPPIPPAGSSQ
jgi:hypothetical protein